MASKFGTMLRRLRLDAGLSQAMLAERAGISANAIGAFEQGARSAPRRETIAALALALQLNGEAKDEFESIASRRRPAATQSIDNLPWQATSFVGRAREIEQIAGLLAQRRLVTVTGSGGIGKTRTSIELASRLSPRPPDGIWFADFASVCNDAGVLGKLSSVLGLKVSKDGDVLTAIVAGIEGHNMLLILDNCEHVIDDARAVAEAIIRSCPRVALLATSRERLRVDGERAYRLGSLPVPTRQVDSAEEGRSYDALALFADRAAAAQHEFHFSDEHVEAAVEICRRLDGIALAIELAAARLPSLGLPELRTQLSKHFGLLAGGSPSSAPRHQALQATISWSYHLLSEKERTLFGRLAIFAGGWTLEAALSVCAGGIVEKADLLDGLLSLVEKSLVVAELSDPNRARYSFFESTREYAAQKLATDVDRDELARGHANWVGDYVNRGYDLFATMPRRQWEDSMRPDYGNALAALDWALGSGGDDVVAARIASGLRGLWGNGALACYGKRYVEAALERISEDLYPGLTARLLLAQAAFFDPAAMAKAMHRAIPLLECAGDRRTQAMCYGYLAYALTQDGNYSDARDAYGRASELLYDEALLQSTLYVGVLAGLGMLSFRQGRLDEATDTLAEALSLAIDIADDWSISICQTNLSEVEFAKGDVLRAVDLAEEALTGAREANDTYRENCALCNLACFRMAIGDIDAAEACAKQVLTSPRTTHAVVLHVAIQHLATVAALRHDPKRAALLLGYVNEWCDRVRYQRDPTERAAYDILMKSLQSQLAESEIAALAARGARLNEQNAIQELAE